MQETEFEIEDSAFEARLRAIYELRLDEMSEADRRMQLLDAQLEVRV